MSPGANKRQTGTVPKAKTSRKTAVPQEMMVAPTRRDLQQHLNVSIPKTNDNLHWLTRAKESDKSYTISH